MAKPADLTDKQLTRRVALIGGVQAIAFFGLASRLGQLQFLHADKYTMQSEENRIKIQVVPPIRGVVHDRSGQALADNKVNYRLFLERDHPKQAKRSLERLASILGWDEQTRQEIEKKLKESRRHIPSLLQENMTWEQVVKTEFHLPELPGVFIEEGQLRYYPLAEKASHLLGYVGRVAPGDEEDDSPLYRLPEFKIGKNGVELRYEDELRGRAGSRQLEVNAKGITVRELNYQPFHQGQEIRLTIDAELQAYAAERLGEESGAIVVMDAHHGDVLACVSMPAFDPNQFSKGISTNYWKSLLEHERNPLLNKALSGIYPPGSTFKMLVGLAGLEAGVITPSQTIYCPGHYVLGNRRFNCWKAGGHGSVNLNHAIAESCDTYFYKVGERVGIDAITDMARRFGLGEVSGLGLTGEKSGLLPSDEWKRRVHQTPWVKGDTINASIGQGFVLATPIQLAIMTARLVTGKQVEASLSVRENPSFAPINIETSYLQYILEGMRNVTMAGYGTAYARRIKEEGMEMGGKTGTSQVKRITRRGIRQSSLPWEHRHHALFVGYAPVNNPSVVASVVIEHGGGGSSAAAPVARDVLHKVQQLAQAHPKRYRW